MALDIVRDDLKLPGDSGEVPISEWSGWWFKTCCEIFSLFDQTKTSWVDRKPKAHHIKVGSKSCHASRRFLSKVEPMGSHWIAQR